MLSHSQVPVEKEESEGKAEPDADEAELLDVVGQQVVDHLKALKKQVCIKTMAWQAIISNT